jgi:diguanylate cyclase (GGDEF)-like protein
MLNAIGGEHLKSLFTTGTWPELFETLSETLGFSLSIYSSKGTAIFISRTAPPLCMKLHALAPDVKSQCEAHCRSFLENTLTTGAPNVFTCYAKITCFAVPIAYLDEKAVVLGQGSFSSYADFRESMDLISTYSSDDIPVKTPLTFTNTAEAWKACRFVAGMVNQLLKNIQDTATLGKKFESLMSVFSLWGSAPAAQPELRYQDMLYNLATLLDIDRIIILAHDQPGGRYISLYGLTKSGAQTAEFSIGAEDTIVNELLSGKPFIRSPGPAAAPAADQPNDHEPRYFFPIFTNKTLTGILCISDRILQERDRQIISGFCKQTALFIENYQLHQDLYKKISRFASMSELTKAITPIQNYDTLLQSILEKSAELLKAEQGSLMMLDHKTDELLLEAKKGLIEGMSGKISIRRGEGIAGKVAERGEPFLVKNLESDPRFKQKNRLHYRTRSFVSVPLMIEDRVIGVINLSDKTTGEVFDEEDLRLIQSIATHAAVVVERNEFYYKSEALKKLTITDSLTGLLNRRYVLERLKDELSRSERHSHPMSLLMLDLDGFKCYNDTQGHIFGDNVLKVTAETLLSTVRTMDIVARYGGDEFIIILPETARSMAVYIAERIRSNVEEMRLPPLNTVSANCRPLTTSIGIVCYPENGDTAEGLLENVDKALYRAKSNGKNRMEVFA